MPGNCTDIPAAPLDLVPLALRSASNQQLTLAIDIEGRIDAEQLREALHLLVTHYPILGYQLFTDTRWPTWRKAASTDLATPLRIAETKDGRRALHDISPVEQNALITVSTNILRGPNHDTLKICVDHTVADAAGAKEIAYTLASCYGQLECDTQHRPLQQKQQPRSLKNICAQVHMLRKLTAVSTWRPTQAHWRFPEGDASYQGATVYTIRQLDNDSITHLKTYCARYAATINDILMTALFCSLHDLHNCTPGAWLPVQFTVDLRRHLDPGHPCQVANLSSSAHIWLRKLPANPFGQTLLETHQALAALKRKAPGIGAAIILEMIFKLGFSRTNRALEELFTSSLTTGWANPLFINTGVIDEKRLKFGAAKVLNAHLLGPSLLVPGLTMTASSFKNRLTLSVGSSPAVNSAGYIKKLMDSMINTLPT